jgi:hypothetical protein
VTHLDCRLRRVVTFFYTRVMTSVQKWELPDLSSDGNLLRAETAVRQLLQYANDDAALAAQPLAHSLCEATGIFFPRDALKFVIASAFRDVGTESRARDLFLAPSGGVRRIGGSPHGASLSTKFRQRRRAQAISILALYIWKLLGTAPSAADRDDEAPRDCLEAIVTLVSDVEPAIAAEIMRLGGPFYAEKASVLAFRGSVEAGDATGNTPPSQSPTFLPLFAVLQAQSEQLNGNVTEAWRKLRPLLTQAPRDATYGSEVRFELEWLNLLRARHCGNVGQMERIAANLARIAQQYGTAMSRALLAQADARIRRGRLYDATVLLDAAEQLAFRKFKIRHLSSCSLLRAEIALQHGNYALAERLAEGAHVVLRGRHYDAYRSQAAIARSCLALGKRWSNDSRSNALPFAAYDRLALDIESARHELVAGSIAQARLAAFASYATAVRLHYEGLAARAASTIGRTYEKFSQQRDKWYAIALSLLLRTRDRSMAWDLFLENKTDLTTPFEGNRGVIPHALYDALLENIPHVRKLPPPEAGAALEFLKQVSTYVFENDERPHDAFEPMFHSIARSGSFAQFLAHYIDEAKATLTVGFAATLGGAQRGYLDQRLSDVFSKLADAVAADGAAPSFTIG